MKAPSEEIMANERKELNVEKYILLHAYNVLADNTGLSSFV